MCWLLFVFERMATELVKLKTRLDEPPSPEIIRPAMGKDTAPTFSTISDQCPPGEQKETSPPSQQTRQGGWTKVKGRKTRVITGTQKCEETQGRFLGAPPVSSIFVYRVEKGATADDVRKWLADRNVNVVAVRMLSHPDAALSSFKVTLRKEHAKILLTPDFGWPENIKVRRFIPGPSR